MHVDSGVRVHGDLLGLRADGIARAAGRQHSLPSDVNLAVGSGLGTTRDIAHSEAMRKRPGSSVPCRVVRHTEAVAEC